MEIQQCRETLSGLQEAYHKEMDVTAVAHPATWGNHPAAAASQPGGGGTELQNCHAALGGLEEAYYRERGDLETGVPEPVVATIQQARSPSLPSFEGSDTESIDELRAFRAARAP